MQNMFVNQTTLMKHKSSLYSDSYGPSELVRALFPVLELQIT